MNKRIVRRHPIAVDGLPTTSFHPVLRRVLQNRGVNHPQEVDHSLQRLLPYADLKNIDAAVNVLVHALENKFRIVIIGDFDADGATSTVVAVRCLRLLGANEVHYRVPNRFKFGYGLTPQIVEETAKELQPDLIITVDNGISSVDGVRAANALNIAVLITDHHLQGPVLPAAAAIVNPNQHGDQFASKNLAGVGVIFYVMLALRARLRESNWFSARGISEPNLAQVLDLVALGTVADVVILDQNNRVLVNQGLKRIRAGHANAGINALLEVAKRSPDRLVASDLGFAIGPRLNAAGRLDDMSIGIRCLLTDSIEEARTLASQLDHLNLARREIENDMQTQALFALDQFKVEDNSELPLGLCIYNPTWHQGVIGILAGRLKDRLHRPVIACAPGDDGEIKGSARSVVGVHIRDVLDAVAARHPGLLTKFGGHSMAAGLTIKQENLATFQAAFDAEVRLHLDPATLHAEILSDGELSGTDFTLDLAQMLRDAAPWGQGFASPVFDGHFTVISQRVLKEKHLKLVLDHPGLKKQIEAIAFNAIGEDGKQPVKPGDGIHLAFKLEINEFRGESNLQLMVEHLQRIE